MLKKMNFSDILDDVKTYEEIQDLLNKQNDYFEIVQSFKDLFYEIKQNPSMNINTFYSKIRRTLNIEKKKLPESEED